MSQSHSAFMHSAIEAIAWPALPTPPAAELLAQLYQLEQTQWWPAAALAEKQLRQFALLADHAYRQAPFYRRRLDLAGLAPRSVWSRETYTKIPLLTRAELLAQASDIFCRAVPETHGAVNEIQTTGSSGQPVTVRRTGVSQLTWLVLTMRDHFWQQRDFGASLAVIRAAVPVADNDDEARRNGWGAPASLLFPTGPGYALPISVDVAQQAEWLLRRNPGYLLTYPTNLNALLSCFERLGRFPAGLRQVRSISETLPAELRARCRQTLGVEVVDMYSSQEVGVIALQCPVSGLYHVQSESLLVEVLDDAGQPCAPGQVGRVVVTDLHNFATPIIRYEIRDYAEVGPPCPCGRGLPTLARIAGRERNMVVLPNGERHWPLVGYHRFREIAPITQFQLLQHSVQEVEVRLAVEQPLSAQQEARLTDVIQTALGHPFPLRFNYFSGELPRTQGGKFEEFACLIATGDQG